MKTYLLILFSAFVSVESLAQRQNVYYLKNNGKFVDTRDSADFIRVVSEPDSGSKLYNIKEFYPNGGPKLIGKTYRIELPMLEGQSVTYYSSGKRKQLANHKRNALDGDIYDFYPNGILYMVTQYSENTVTHEPNIRIKTNNDSTGKALVINGNGYYVGYDEELKYVAEQGKVKDSVKDSVWTGQEIIKETKITFTEFYENGKLLSGWSTKNGDTVKYSKRQVQPEFKGGEAKFGRFLMENVRYPKYERENNIMGRAYITFVVEKDGSLTDIEPLISASPGLSAESIRVLKLSPKWMPGYRMGRAVRVQYTVPVNFSLAN